MSRIPTCLAVLALAVSAAGAQTKLLRFPDVHGDRVVFTHAGDLWSASADGGAATRLTVHPGVELFGKFSPDGKWIAFTGQYDGDEQVHVIPSDGGAPTQLTYYPARGPLPEVDNDPASVLAGEDRQLETAVAEILRKMGEDPKRLPERPAPPVRTE